MTAGRRKTIVVVGLGMVGIAFMYADEARGKARGTSILTIVPAERSY